jgi:hypothetical protein
VRLRSDDPLAISLNVALRTGDQCTLKRLLEAHPGLAAARIDSAGRSRTPVHEATDWPGHFPNCVAVVAMLIAAGADVNARCEGMCHAETPLHWAASSDDVEVLELLVQAGADIDAPGGLIGGGTPLDNAVGYGQWRAAHRLVECGARTTFWHSAALGLMSRVRDYLVGDASSALDLR